VRAFFLCFDKLANPLQELCRCLHNALRSITENIPMAGAQIKIFAAIFALVVLLGTLGGAVYFWEKIFKPEIKATKEIRAEMSSKAPKSDPGKPVYDSALTDIRGGNFPAAREKLHQLMRIYADSPKAPDARRILGEMNADRLFSKDPGPGKLEFKVEHEPGLEVIAKRGKCTIPFLRKVNGLTKSTIHPGDHLILQNLEFQVEVNVAAKTFTVRQNGEFFKQYTILEFGEGVVLPKTSFIDTKQGSIADKPIRDSDIRWPQAKKWLQTKSSASRTGIIFCGPPKKGGDVAVSGVYLSVADIDELCTILRVGTPIAFHLS
jgi:hypothetical protein